MSIKSMTGFARSDGSSGATSWHWELRSVNGRGLDLRLRLPPGYEALEPRLRETASRFFSRGSVSLNLNVKRDAGQAEIRLNEAVLGQVLQAMKTVGERIVVAPPRADQILALKGVLEFGEAEEDEAAAKIRNEAIMASLETALAGVVEARSLEGARLQAVIEAQIRKIESLVAEVESAPGRSAGAMQARLKDQLAKVMETGHALDETRLYQEAALLATRLDVEEELKRLRAHIEAARELLGTGEAVGRRLDFLAQEFNREANTICSKANDPAITKTGLALKAVIDQMREQVQNIE